jgi:NAD(P)-dependent dehydrogenase (short-subunit alcohol dehydrogenase family)
VALKVSVITGGAGGMGLATAKLLGRDHLVVISDVNQDRLASAGAELERLGIRHEQVVCNISDPSSVAALIQRGASLGALRSVVHTAGLSPQMADGKTIMTVNALGTVHVIDACYEAATAGFVLVNIASMAAHIIPALLLPKRAYPLAFSEPEAFLEKSLRISRLMPRDLHRKGVAYGISKHFVIWASRKSAARFGAKGARVLSVSPGSFDTAMGRLEEKSGSAAMLETAALKRFGTPEEIAELLAFVASDKASYLTGTDILCDGGVIAGRQRD